MIFGSTARPRIRRAARPVLTEALEGRALLSGNFVVDDATVIEGNSGTTALVFNVSWVGAGFFDSGAVTVATSDGTAWAVDGDYVPLQQRFNFGLFGPRTQQFVVIVKGDTRNEPSETVKVILSDPANAGISDDTGVGTIVDDDLPPAPTNLAAYNLENFDRLVFNDDARTEVGYSVDRFDFSQNVWNNGVASITSPAPSATGPLTLKVPTAPSSVGYNRYRVHAFWIGGESAASNPADSVLAGLRETVYDTNGLRDNPSNPDDPDQRFDVEINHNFDVEGSPAPGIVDADTFSIVWEGNFTPPQTGNYTLVGGSDDGMRVYLDGNLVVDDWVDHPYTEVASAPQALTGGRKYELRVEYFENFGGAAAKLQYEGPGVTGRQVIPFTQLSPPTGTEPLHTPADVHVSRIADCVTVFWHDLSSSESYYEIQRSTTRAGGYVTVTTARANADHVPDPGPLTVGETYYYRVGAVGAGGSGSVFSAPIGPVVPTAPAGDVAFPTFADNNAAAAMTFNGTARLVDRDGNRTRERLMLTEAQAGQVGSAYLTEPRNVRGFYAGFDFQVTNGVADGFTFIIQASPAGTAALGVGGGGLAYNGIPNSVAVKYDFSPFINQTGVYRYGDAISDDANDARNREIPMAFNLDNGQVYHTTLAYDYATRTLTQTIDDVGNAATAPFTATYRINIPAALESDCAYVGFTGGTGDLFARQEILDMTFSKSSPAPRVQQVYVSGSTWAPAFKTYLASHGLGSAAFGYALPTGSAQTDDLPWTNIDQVSVTFDRPVSIDGRAMAIRGVNVANYLINDFTYDRATRTGTWTLGGSVGSVGSDKLLLDLDGDSDLVNAFGFPLDGTFATGATLPSGDGTPGGDFRFRLNVLPGDVDRSGTVLASDFSAVKQKFFSSAANPGTGAAAYNFFHDVNGSGSILADDFSAVKQRFFAHLPAAPAPATPAATVSFSTDARPLLHRPRASELFGSDPILG